MNCPICTNLNACAQTCGSGRQTCWCFDIKVSKALIECLRDSEINYSCLCRGCLTAVVAHSDAGASPRAALDQVIAERGLVAA